MAQTSISIISDDHTASTSLVLNTTNDGAAYCTDAVPAGTEFPDLLTENASSVPALQYSDLYEMEFEDDLQDWNECDKSESGILTMLTRNVNVQNNRETGSGPAETTWHADGSVPRLRNLPDAHVEMAMEEKGVGGSSDGIAEFHGGQLNQRERDVLRLFKQRDRRVTLPSNQPVLNAEHVISIRIPSGSDDVETNYFAAVPVSPEIPGEANGVTYAFGTALPSHETPSTNIIVSSVENMDFDSYSLTHWSVSDTTSHGDKLWITCAVCSVNIWRVVFLPCGHLSCVSCYKKLTRCHTCRNRIDSVVQIFLA